MLYELNPFGDLGVRITCPINTVPWSPMKYGVHKSQGILMGANSCPSRLGCVPCHAANLLGRV